MENSSEKIIEEQTNSGESAKKAANSITPMMQQYLDIKAENSEYLLFYRMGDFYELFFDDAILAAKELDIVLTRRGKNDDQDIPMCGVPHHSHESYLNKLIKKGYKVAICDQIETPEEAKKSRGYKAVVKREVTRIVTQGTLTDEKLLENDISNFILAFSKSVADMFSLAWADISTGELLTGEVEEGSLISEIERINPAEIIISDEDISDRELKNFVDIYRNKITTQNKSFFSKKRSKDRVVEYFNLKNLNSLSDMGEGEVNSLGALIEYINITQFDRKPNLSLPRSTKDSDFLEIDSSTYRSLEIFRDFEGSRKNSLFGILNRTKTSCGSRLLYNYLARPLKNIKKINERYEGIGFFIKNFEILSKIDSLCSRFPDIERISSRIHLNKGNPKDVAALRDGILIAIKISEALTFAKGNIKTPKILRDANKNLTKLESVYHKINEVIIEFPPINLNEGGYVKQGFDSKLDDYRNAKAKSVQMKKELLEKYIKISDIPNLKIKENNVIGMFFETSPNNIDKIPASFVHKQTLASCVRYKCDELREIENKIINAENYAIAIELEIFAKIRELVISEIENIRALSKSVAVIDILANFANISVERNYCRPELDNSDNLEIKDGRHPIVEQFIKADRNLDISEYVPNDINLNDEKIWLLTGPNMSGKSTFLRQNALICIIAQIGCFVPALSAQIGLVDKLFSRVGAYDNLSKGQSTFMVEMSETAFILNNATKKSFVILDEIGRGTSTFDGLSIAWATLEHLDSQIKCRGLFATHYHELTTLAKNSKNIENYTLETQEWHEDIIFKHKIIQGVAGESYGVHVAKFAGMPKQVTNRANEILSTLKRKNKNNSSNILNNNLPLFSNNNNSEVSEKGPKNKRESELQGKFQSLVSKVSEVDINNLTPLEALNLIYKLKKELD